jgi:hypothetical protein
MFHVTGSVIPGFYIEQLWSDRLYYDQMIIVKRGQELDLSNPLGRELAVRQILGLIRYLSQYRVYT